jgi:tetratricopeptide (TPR) repeat protein
MRSSREETWEDYLAVELEKVPKASRSPEEREAAACLLDELMAMPPAERLDRLETEERFLSPVLFEVLLERGHSTLPGNPLQAAELLEVAIELGMWLDGREEFDGPAEREALARGLCLLGTADRLRGELVNAEVTLVRAGGYAVDPMARGFFARSLGLLRWDQGRNEEAFALLRHGVGRFGELGARKEQGACYALLALLALEEEDTIEAGVYLRQARRALEAGSRLEPWLAAQTVLGWALHLARCGKVDQARAVRKAAWEHYREVTHEEALVSVYWLEGRVAVEVGDVEDGLSLLDSVRRKQIQAGWLIEATLASVDLGLGFVRQGRAGELKRLANELSCMRDSAGYAIARRTLGLMADEAVADPAKAVVWSMSGPSLRQAFRLAGVRPRPVPFA